MEKVLLTTYRKLYRMCCRVDASVAMRTQLMCCPLQMYDHQLMEWQPFDVSEMAWAESRVFVDALIRRLNNGRPQYIPPLPEEAVRAVQAYHEQCAALFSNAAAATDAPASIPTAAEGATAAAEKASSSAAATAVPSSSPSSSSPSAARDGAADTSAGAAQSTPVPLAVLPYSTLTTALRQIYEATPFSVNNLATAFAAVKELQYVCELDDAGKAKLVTLAAASSASSSGAAEVPRLQRTLDVMPLHFSLIHGLSAEMRVSLDRQTRRAKKRRGAAQKGGAEPPATMAAATAAAIVSGKAARGGNAFDNAPDVAPAERAEAVVELHEAEAGGTGTAAEETEGVETQGGQQRGAGDASAAPSVAAGLDTTADVAATFSGSALGEQQLPSSADMAKEPEAVQLLLAHPTARGFFRRTVLLVARHVSHESAAFVLNKPLRNEEGQEMSVEATVRLGRVHPIFRRYLANHTLMIGGPVMSGSSFDESIFLLHRVPGVPNALPLGSNLWLDGDLDALMAALEARTASAVDDVVVLCGFAGWGVGQLAGELGNGYWVVATGPSADAAVGRFVMSLTHTSLAAMQSGVQATAVAAAPASAGATPSREFVADAPAPDATTAPPQSEAIAGVSEEDRVRAEAQRAADAAASRAMPSLKRRRRRANFGKVQSGHIETLSWVRAYASVGHPYADMAMNQNTFAKDDDFQE